MSAIKVNKCIPAFRQLEIFINSLGIIKTPEVYIYDKHGYINIDLLLQPLAISIKWFLKNAKFPTHYITIKKRIFINKYGLTKLLAQSKEVIAFQLQDCIYEIIYKLENTEISQIKDVDSHILTELNIYKAVEKRNQLILDDLTKELRQIQATNEICQVDNETLRDENETLRLNYDTLLLDYSKLKDITIKIASYIKYKNINKNTKTKLYEKLEDICEEVVEDLPELDSGDDYAYSINELKKQALSAKKKLNMITNTTNTITTSDVRKTYYIMNNVNVTFNSNGEKIHKWIVADKLPIDGTIMVNNITYDNYKKFSQDYRLGDIKQYIYEYIWFCDIDLTDINLKILVTVINIVQYLTESDIMQLISVLN
jgi:hypothetical protein